MAIFNRIFSVMCMIIHDYLLFFRLGILFQYKNILLQTVNGLNGYLSYIYPSVLYVIIFVMLHIKKTLLYKLLKYANLVLVSLPFEIKNNFSNYIRMGIFNNLQVIL